MPRIDSVLQDSEIESRNRAFDTGRIYMAEVMDTRSATNAGELKVWILNSGIDKYDSEKWVVASYASPFYGTTPYKANVNDYYNAPKSFGSWFPIPCVGNYVFIFYACMYGENVQPFWFSCPVDPDVNFMLPGIPNAYTNEKGPVCELNNKNKDSNYYGRQIPLTTKEDNQQSYDPLKTALEKQGLWNDKLRGPSTAGSKRESPSMCYGHLTPLGNSFVMDDGWAEDDNRTDWDMVNDKTDPQLLRGDDGLSPFQRKITNRYNAGFRFRTRNGTQVLISDNGNVYTINRDGTAWTEITDDGYIDCWSKNGINASSDGDINLYSKRKIRMEAEEGFAFKTKGSFMVEADGDVNFSTPRIKTDSIITAPEVNAKLGNIESFASAMAQINGTFKGTLQGTAFYATNAGIIPVQQPEPLTPAPDILDVVVEPVKEVSGQNGEFITTIDTRVPTAEPYDGHNKNNMFPELDVIKKPYKGKNYLGYTPIITNQVMIPENINDTGIDTSALIPEIQLSEHYTLRDLCASSTADRYGINNSPEDAVIERLKLLANNVLEPITSNYGKKLTVNSGFRCIPLNTAVGGKATSQHCNGEAADIEIMGISNYDLACWVRDNLDFDQVILEFADNILFDKNSGWVHVSYKSSGNRKQALTINKSGTKSGIVK